MNTLMKRNSFAPSTSFFDDFLTRELFNWSGLANDGGSVPQVNIVENDDEFRVEMAAPGMSKKDFNVQLDNDMLTIQSARQESQEDQENNYARREFSYKSFKRSFYLPNTVEADKIKATYRDGILSLVIPKKEEARRKPVKTIDIS